MFPHRLFPAFSAAFMIVLAMLCPAHGGDNSRGREGTFLGIEQGDYPHWKMKTAGGEELSYFILRPDKSVAKAVENPKPYIGKKCRVQWKSSTENIPEAGGKMKIQQILTVEWLGRN